jgi:nicotinate-nucleotide adenylyltransferase
MCHLAFDELGATVSDLEIRRGGKSYTVLTLEELSAPDTRVLLLCGTDMFLTLDTWYMPERIFELAEIVYAVREEGEEGRTAALAMAKRAQEYRTRFGATVHALPLDSLELSSSELRAMLAEGKDTTSLLHPKVKEYIERCNLYHA